MDMWKTLWKSEKIPFPRKIAGTRGVLLCTPEKRGILFVLFRRPLADTGGGSLPLDFSGILFVDITPKTPVCIF